MIIGSLTTSWSDIGVVALSSLLWPLTLLHWLIEDYRSIKNDTHNR
jgi:hypothetical protein